LLRAANLLPGFMEIPTDPGVGQEPRWSLFDVERSRFTGEVFRLEVERWQHYVSGGAIVHNSDVVYLFPDVSLAGMREWLSRGEQHDNVVRQFYVGMTRAREELVVCGPSSTAHVDMYRYVGVRP
jgi:hypothetical protein